MEHPNNSKQRVKRWCFTWNNYEEDDIKYLLDTVFKQSMYVLFAKEVSTTGTPHLQGYIELKTRKTLVALKKLITDKPHLSPAQGSAEQNYTYIVTPQDLPEDKRHGKTNPPVEDVFIAGEPQLSHTDKCALAISLAESGDFDELKTAMPDLYLQRFGTLKRIRADNLVDRTDLETLDNLWLVGPAGTGKSRWARDNFPTYYLKTANDRWWDHYNGEEVVLVEEVGLECKPMGNMYKVWTDHYFFSAEFKGGTFPAIRPKKFIFTSNFTISEIWDDPRVHEPILRRFTIKEFS